MKGVLLVTHFYPFSKLLTSPSVLDTSLDSQLLRNDITAEAEQGQLLWGGVTKYCN